MDIGEFQKRVLPRAKRSKLDPFKDQIFKLKEMGYANWQICQWLGENDVKVSPEGVRKFINSRQSDEPALKESAESVSPDPAQKEDDHTSNDLAGMDSKQRRERLADKFIKSENTNPFLKRLKEKTK